MPTRAHGRSSEDGFTLVELLVVTVLIGVLATIVVSVFLAQRTKATGATARSDLRNAATMEEAQLTDTGSYTASVATLLKQGFSESHGLEYGFADTADGYCEVASSDGTYWWFDSSAGGVQGATTTTLTPPTSANGICAKTAPTQLSQPS
jgi:prepilin-type N-terminal cleavage/methylation domain-containing protein